MKWGCDKANSFGYLCLVDRTEKDRFEVTVYLNWTAVETLRNPLSTLLETQVETVSSEGCHIFKKFIFTERVAELGFVKKT
jgi:hypothetical protein